MCMSWVNSEEHLRRPRTGRVLSGEGNAWLYRAGEQVWGGESSLGPWCVNLCDVGQSSSHSHP